MRNDYTYDDNLLRKILFTCLITGWTVVQFQPFNMKISQRSIAKVLSSKFFQKLCQSSMICRVLSSSDAENDNLSLLTPKTNQNHSTHNAGLYYDPARLAGLRH